MNTTSIKRGSVVSTLVPLAYYTQPIPEGSLAQVLKVKRSGAKDVAISVGGNYVWVRREEVKLVELTNQKVPKEGDIFLATWGYGQTNCSWFKVKAATKKTVTVSRVGETRTYSKGGMCGECVVNPADDHGVLENFRLNYDLNGNPSFKMASYGRAFLVADPKKPVFFSEWN